MMALLTIFSARNTTRRFSCFRVFFFLAFCSLNRVISQTSIAPGDLAVMGVNANNIACGGSNTEDLISFVCFKDITPGTTIDITDNGWEQANPGFFADTEGTVRMTANGLIPKGEVITISAINTPETYTCVSHPGVFDFENINTGGFAMNMNSAGDQFYFISGGVWDVGDPNPNTHDASYIGGAMLYGFSSSGWGVATPPPGNSQESNLHPAVVPCFHQEPTTGQSNFLKYTGPLTPATQLQWISRIKNPANWTAFPACSNYNSANPNLIGLTIQILPSNMSITCNGTCGGCAPLAAQLTLELPTTGGPFIVTYTNGTQNFTLNNAVNGQAINVVVNTTTTYSLVSVTDQQGCPVYSNFEGSAELVVGSPPVLVGVTSNSPICEGETLELFAPTIPNATYAWSGPLGFGSFLEDVAIDNAITDMSGTYTVIASIGTCVGQPVNVNVLVSAAPDANATDIEQCGSNGTATFDLTSVNLIVNGNSGSPVTWYVNANGTGQIANPTAFVSGNNTVYATVSNGLCTSQPAPVNLTVLNLETPDLNTATICQNSGLFNLNTIEDPNYPDGTWSGPGVSGNNFNPAGQSGIIQLTFNPASDCADVATTTITVNVPASPAITGVPASICQSSNAISLPTTQGGVVGNWSGNGVLMNQFNPMNLSGVIPLTFTPNAGLCASNATTSITVNVPATPVVTGVPASLCQSSMPIALPTTLGSITGNWSGSGVANNQFDPAGLSGTVGLMFTPTAGLCAHSTNYNIVVNLVATPQLQMATLCQTSGLYSLANIADPNYPTGTWAGNGVNGNNFDPAGQTGTINLTFTPTAACTQAGNTTITVNTPAIPILTSDVICQNSGNFDLTTLLDPNFPTGTWTGQNVTGNIFDPTGLNGAIPLTFTPSAACTQAGSTNVSVVSAPTFSMLSESCDNQTQTFTVSFTINGGAPASYTINGQPHSGNTYLSLPIPSGSVYTFNIDDENGCGPVVVSGTRNCTCATSAGSMDLPASALQVCEGSAISVNFNNDQNLEGDDVLQFALHDNPGATLGNVIAWSSSTNFPYPAGVIFGQTYYVSAVAATNAGNGTPNLTDGCLSVSQGVPVVFYQPAVQFGNGGSVCNGDCFTLNVSFAGIAPYSLDYQVIANGVPVNETLTSNSPTGTISICPADYGATSGQIQVIANTLSDANCTRTLNNAIQETIIVLPIPQFMMAQTLCPGDQVVVNGVIYDESHPMGIETVPNGSYLGCDSMVSVNLNFLPEATFNLSQTLCTGGSVLVNGMTYSETNPTGVEVLQNQSVNGCDSTVFITLTFTSSVVNNLSPTLCPGESLMVNGQTYDQANPSGSETIPGGSYLNCDSTIIVNLSFFPPVTFNLTQSLCPGGSVIVNGMTYDEANPTGSEVLENAAANGCDSTVFVNLTFSGAVVNNIAQTLCPEESIVVNGETYNLNNPAGTETIPQGSYLGCDSVIQVNLSFFPAASASLTQTLCTGSSLTVGNMTFDENHPSGTVILPGMSVNGCDSTVFVNLTFNSVVTENINQNLCADETLIVNGTIYDINNPEGTETIPNGSFLGCDSIINVDLNFFPPAESTIAYQLCTGGNITVNGVIYNESNPSGTEILSGQSFHGCDSTVVIDLTFGDEVIVDYTPVLCPGESIFINGTLYFAGNTTGSETFENGSYLGCDSTMNISLSFYPEATSAIDTTLLPGSSLVVGGMIFNSQNPNGVVVIAGGSTNGCDSVIFVTVTFEGQISADADIVAPLCKGDISGSITVNSITGGQPPYKIALDGANSMPVDVLPLIFNDLEAGFHQLTFIDALGVIVLQDLEVPQPADLLLDLGADKTVELGASVQLNVQATFPIATFSWSPSDYLDCTDCADPLVQQPASDQTYTLLATDFNGCTAEGEVSVIVTKVRSVFVPNAFSPNDDGINDKLVVFAGSQVANIKSFLVFNRWGAVVSELYNIPPGNFSFGWNGEFKGKKMDTGVYTWFAEVEFLDGVTQIFEGDVSLVR